MKKKEYLFDKTWIKNLEKLISILANIAVICGIIFVLIQITQANEFEKRRIAIDAVSKTRSNDFLKAFARFKTACSSQEVKDHTIFIDDLNFIINVYDNIAILYINDLADRAIIKANIYLAAKELSSILNTLTYPKVNNKNFKIFLTSMENDTNQ